MVLIVLYFLQDQLRDAQESLDEAEAVQAEVQGNLTNNLLKRKAELDEQLSGLTEAEDRCQSSYPFQYPAEDT